MYHGSSWKVSTGSFLRLSSGGRSLTLGLGKDARLGRNWAEKGWTRRKKQHEGKEDIDLDRNSAVAVQYYLAAMGMLQPAEDKAAGTRPAGCRRSASRPPERC